MSTSNPTPAPLQDFLSDLEFMRVIDKVTAFMWVSLIVNGKTKETFCI